MQGNESNITNAHMCLIQADKFLQQHQWSEANKKYVEASKIFQAAVLATADPQAKRSFEAMVVHCNEKAQLIQSYLMSNSIDLSDTANFSDEDPTSRDEDSQIYLDDYYNNQSNVFQQRIVFGGSTIEEEVIDLYLRPLEDVDKTKNSNAEKQQEKNSDWWGVGKIFRNLLGSPSNETKETKHEDQLDNNSTLDTSFYVMADEARKRMLNKQGKNTPPSTTPVDNTQKTSNSNIPMRKSNDSIVIPDEKKTKQDLLEELKKLRKTVQILSQQNAILLSSTTTPVMHGLIHENTQLRRSIIMMHHRSKKPKVEGDTQNLSMIQEPKGAPQTAPVTPVKIQISSPTESTKRQHLTVHSSTNSTQSQTNDTKLKELEEKVARMTAEIQTKDEELSKYKKRWKVLKTSAKQRQKSAEHNGSNFSLTNESFKRASNEL